MASKTVEKVTVKGLSKFGFQAVTGEYINWAPKLGDAEKGKIVPGGNYELDLFISDSGKKYVNGVKVLDVAATTPKPAVKKVEAKADATMSKAEWQAKDRSQLIGGLSHDAAVLAASLMNVKGIDNAEAAIELFKTVLEGLINVRDRLS